MAELIKVAQKNWSRWRGVFEYSGPVVDNPLLTNKHTFALFLREYYVSRTIWKGRHDELRRKLRNSHRFREAIDDVSGQGLDRLERHLRPRFGSKKGKNRMISVLSKAAAFVRPERFVAWDRFAKKGLNIVLGRNASAPFKTYSSYLAAFESVWESQLGMQIRDYAAKINAHNSVECEPRFLRRVLDIYLMKCGGRGAVR